MKKRRLNYMYSFKCEDEVTHFKKLPNETQGIIESCIVQVICESFVEPADEDYVTARLLAQKGMHRAFFWAASQALEKYLKAFLLMRGASVKCFQGHPIKALFSKACSIDEQLTALDTEFHPEIKFHPNLADSFVDISVSEFINDLEVHGSSDNRYNSFGVSFKSGHIFALDSFIFSLRQQIGVPSIDETLRKLDKELVESFYLYNPWFTHSHTRLAEIPNENFNLSISCSVTTLDRLISTHSPHGSIFVLQWLEKKMKLPWKVKQHLNGTWRDDGGNQLDKV